MVWGIRASLWFGLTLLSLTFFVWCLLEALELRGNEQAAVHAGLTWGLIIFGLIALVAGTIAVVAQFMSGGVSRAKDALTKEPTPPMRSVDSGSITSPSGYDHKSANEIPRSSPGRSLM